MKTSGTKMFLISYRCGVDINRRLFRNIIRDHFQCIINIILFFGVQTLFAGDAGSYTEMVAENAIDVDVSKLAKRCGITLSPKGSYSVARQSVLQQKKQLRHYFSTHSSDTDSFYCMAQVVLENCIINNLIPFWYGTPWDFNGYSPNPKKGHIACGYFVSTVLLHCGFSLNRYTLAQQAPYLEAISLQLNDSIQIYKCSSELFLKQFRQSNKDGLYFIGLDCHVGFLLARGNNLFFLHSSYYDSLCVTIEYAATSFGIAASSTFYIAELSTNRKLIDSWCNDTKIIIRME